MPQERDLTQEDQGGQGLLTPQTTPDPRDSVRKWVILGLLGMFAATIAASFVYMWLHPTKIETLKTFLLVFLPSLTGFIGTALGFYFGQQMSK